MNSNICLLWCFTFILFVCLMETNRNIRLLLSVWLHYESPKTVIPLKFQFKLCFVFVVFILRKNTERTRERNENTKLASMNEFQIPQETKSVSINFWKNQFKQTFKKLNSVFISSERNVHRVRLGLIWPDEGVRLGSIRPDQGSIGVDPRGSGVHPGSIRPDQGSVRGQSKGPEKSIGGVKITKLPQVEK